MRTSRLITAVALLGTVGVLSGCASGIHPSSDAGVDYSRGAHLAGTLDVSGFGLGDDVATVRYAAAEKALGPDVHIRLAEGALDTQAFLSAVAAGDPPDLVYASRDAVGSLATQGALMPLDRCIRGSGTDTSTFRRSAMQQVSARGHVYGVPEFNQLQLTMASTPLLAEAGLTIDDVNGSDWDAMRRANEAMTVTSGSRLDVIGVDGKMPDTVQLWALANGATLISADGRHARLDDPRVIEAVRFASSLTGPAGGFSKVKAVRDSADLFGAGNQFAKQQLGAEPMDNWYVNVLEDVSPKAQITFDAFRDRQGRPIAFAGGSAWAIPVGAKDTAAACRFATTMTSVDTWLAAARHRKAASDRAGTQFSGLLTANTVADDRIEAMALADADEHRGAPNADQWLSAVKAIYLADDHAVSGPPNPAGSEFQAAWQDAVNAVLNGQETPEAALTTAQHTAQAALDAAWSKEDR